MRQQLRTALFLTIVGGLSRFSQGRLDIMFDEVLPIVLIELVVTPGLWGWSTRLDRTEPASRATTPAMEVSPS